MWRNTILSPRKWGLAAFVAALCIFENGCAMRYANVYVNTVQRDTHTAVSVDLYDGRSGLSLGQTPVNIPLRTVTQKVLVH